MRWRLKARQHAAGYGGSESERREEKVAESWSHGGAAERRTGERQEDRRENLPIEIELCVASLTLLVGHRCYSLHLYAPPCQSMSVGPPPPPIAFAAAALLLPVRFSPHQLHPHPPRSVVTFEDDGSALTLFQGSLLTAVSLCGCRFQFCAC